MEVRQRPRPTGEQWFESRDLSNYLTAFGDDPPALPETIRVLDILAVDYIIETCYEAESHARHAGRQKVKVDDFQFALRNDPKKLGRIQEMAEKERMLKVSRKAFELPEGEVHKGMGGVEGEDGVKVKGKRGRKKRVSTEMGDGVEEPSPKKGKKGRRRKSDQPSQVMSGGIGEEDLDLDDAEDD